MADPDRFYMVLRRTNDVDDEPPEYEHLGTWESPASACDHVECAAKEMVEHPPRGVDWLPGDRLLIVPMRSVVPVLCVAAVADPNLN